MDQKTAIKVEELAARFLNTFHTEMQKCDEEFDYVNLIASALVFKNLVINHFREELLIDLSAEEADEIIKAVVKTADDVSKTALTRMKSKDVN